MVQITKQKIHLTRGDTLSLELNLTDVNGDPYEPEENDRVVFRLKKNALSDYMLIEQDVDLNTMTLTLSPEQTANLPFGHYKYEIEIISNSYNYTVFENEDFYLGKELSKSTKSVTPSAPIETISLDGIILPIENKNVNIPLIEAINDALENGDIDLTTEVTEIVTTAIQQKDIEIDADEISFENTQIPLPSIIDDNLLEAVQRLYGESVLVVNAHIEGSFNDGEVTFTQNQIGQLLRPNTILHLISTYDDNINIFLYPEIETRIFPPDAPDTGRHFIKYVCKTPYIEPGVENEQYKQYIVKIYEDLQPETSVHIDVEDPNTGFTYIKENHIQINPESPVVTNIILGEQTRSVGNLAVSEGAGYTSGSYAHAEGYNSTASGFTAHAEGYMSYSSASNGHAEGNYTTAIGNTSHAEGSNTLSNGSYTHTEGYYTTALGTGTHAEGYGNVIINSSASGAHAEGYYTTAANNGAHSEGQNTFATGPAAHSEGYGTSALNQYAHSEGYYTQVSAPYSHAEGYYTTVVGNYVNGGHAEGYQTYIGTDGRYGVHAEGTGTTANAESAHAEGSHTYANGAMSHAEGNNTTVSGSDSGHAEGYYTYVGATGGHTEGGMTTVLGSCGHAEGQYNLVTTASNYGHAEGQYTTAGGQSAHSEGSYTYAAGNNSHAGGSYTTALANNSFVTGFMNEPSISDIFQVGNGVNSSQEEERIYKNAFSIDTNGNGTFEGKVTVGAAPVNNMDVATKKYVDDLIAALRSELNL